MPHRLFVLAKPGRADLRVAAPDVVAVHHASGQWTLAAAAWGLAAIPLAWGVFRTLTLASQMFR